MAYSDTTPLNPSSSNGYVTTLPSSVFYGGVLMESYNQPFTRGPWAEVWSGNAAVSPNDQIYYGTSAGSRGWLFVYWKKENFLAGATGRVWFQGGNTIEVSGYAGGDGQVVKNSGRVHIAAREAGQWYLSEAYGGPSASSFVVDPTTTRWATYTPSAPYSIKFTNLNFVSRTFANVDAVGLYHSNDNVPAPATDYAAGFTFLRFKVTATVE